MSAPAAPAPGTRANYVFRGVGAIPGPAVESAADFPEVFAVPVPPETIVFAAVAGPGDLPRILRRLESLGMHVESVHRVRELPRTEHRAPA
ncbi:hypothetical protein [Amycolatopsis dendrobii]|uniref:Uncharacterized protein n=1 Tax=Amycolatopsis dendrobii TaxID=2760662 RepID=A0A7W3VR26_9PSEU|nr:hypothetical protein [Amycolatopsis dendrobii]MBB1151613.1 hypothetical protein [Amycolatopsis dendrobii]